ncbi:MAG: protein-L-isoaspartate(D-aspartate) O-methyltransferase [Nitrospirales bacterium]|nr:protein-L-isoaspartate(D-aspartate) O-methyltransferase [Nitrospirales bacterium]
MVETQLIPRGIQDPPVLNAMRKVPRHLFMPDHLRLSAYEDMALPIDEGQTISQPYMVAVMTELLGLRGTETVLEIGTGSGYQAAILGELAGQVYTVERIELLAEAARQRLRDLGYSNITVISGDGSLGLAGKAPFDAIIVTAAAPSIPAPLVRQLREGGVIIAPVGERYSQILIKGKKVKGLLEVASSTPCVFVPLIGEYGW